MKEYKRNIDYRWSFRDANTKEYTHCYHTYPAMMIPQVARTLMEEYRPAGKFNMVLDPYMGSGTTLVEASLLGVNSIGTDINPLARFISEIKTTHYNVCQLQRCFNKIVAEFDIYDENIVLNKDFERISNYTFWYSNDSLLKLSYLSQLIDKDGVGVEPFFRLLISEIVREASFTRNGEFKRFKMAESSIANFHPDIFKMFIDKYARNIRGLQEYNEHITGASTLICSFNSSIEIPEKIVSAGDVDMVVTSPPYGDSHTTVAYGQFSRWANEWFNFENAKNLDRLLMGGKICKVAKFETISIADVLKKIKDADIRRYWEVISFLNDYADSMQNVAKVVRKGGRVCYVVGNRTVKGIQIPLDYFTAEMFEKFGFKHINTIVREIPNKRMPSKTSPSNAPGAKVSTMVNEYIVILEKT